MTIAFRALAAAALAFTMTALPACAPRGESHTVQQVLESARENYIAQSRGETAEPLKTTLVEVAKSLEEMVAPNASSGAIAPASGKVADTLATLIETSGYTTRPALGEIIMQHRVLSLDAGSADVSQARVKLLVARTYSVLAGEMETTNFSVERLQPLPKA